MFTFSLSHGSRRLTTTYTLELYFHLFFYLLTNMSWFTRYFNGRMKGLVSGYSNVIISYLSRCISQWCRIRDSQPVVLCSLRINALNKGSIPTLSIDHNYYTSLLYHVPLKFKETDQLMDSVTNVICSTTSSHRTHAGNRNCKRQKTM